MVIIVPESGTALIWKISSTYNPLSRIHIDGIGFGGASRLIIVVFCLP